MCGIVGYLGGRNAAPLLVESLRRLEYRGYDSAGLALMVERDLTVLKVAGRIADLEHHLGGEIPFSTHGIAHTRWATHGEPNQINAHPHVDCNGTLAVVHNGIFENANALREWLTERGHNFRSDTDTEVLAHLVEELLDGNLETAVAAALREIEGAYGIAVMSASDPDLLVAARRGSPLLIGLGEGEYFVSSDASALLEHTREVVYLDDGEMAVIRRSGYHITDLETTPVEKTVSRLEWDIAKIERGGYPHFMLKEIMEQPESLCDTLRGRLLHDEGNAKLSGLNLSDDDLLGLDRIVLTACGTSWHAALIGEYMLEEFARIPVEVEYASEFRYRNPIVDQRCLVVAISQSGETADTLAAVREARKRGAPTVGVINVVGSTIAREVGGGIYTHAGPEIGVASTKAFTSQIAALALLTLRLGRLRSLPEMRGRELVQALSRLPGQMAQVLDRAREVEELAETLLDASNALYLGRGFNFPVALEGALKLKEISYIHAEGYPAAEMKHGPIALIDELMPVVIVAPRDSVYRKILSNLEEVKARRGRVLAVVTEGDQRIREMADHVITIPATLDPLIPILAVLPLQLLAYYTAVGRGCDVDRPRNLAKSVTVE